MMKKIFLLIIIFFLINSCGSTIQHSSIINNTDEAVKAASWSNNFTKRWKPETGMTLNQFYNLWIYSAPYVFINRTNKGYYFKIFIKDDTSNWYDFKPIDWKSISIENGNELIEFKNSNYWVLSLHRMSSDIYYFNIKTKILEKIDNGEFLESLATKSIELLN